MLTFQIIFFLLPIIACSYFIFTAQEYVFIKVLVYIITLVAVIHWISYNLNNKIVFEIEDQIMTVKKGFPLSHWFTVDIRTIDYVYIEKSSGEDYVSQYLNIKLKNGEEIGMGCFYEDRHKHYFKALIEYYREELVK